MHNNRRVIGICTSELDQKFHMRLLDRVVKAITDLGYYAILFGTDSDMFHLTESDIADAAVFDLVNLDIVDLVLLFSETIKQQSVINHIVQKITSKGAPVISIGREVELCYNVIYDQDSAFEKLVRHIVEYHNVREINFITGTKGNEVAEKRLEIYQRVLDENEILYEPDRVGYGDFWDWPTRKVMDEFITPSKIHPEAIICANDSMAVAVCDYLREHDIRVPEDILVAGFDGIEEGVKHTPGITTCARNEVQDARTIAELARTLCDGKQINVTTVLDYHVQLSQSCGCQKHHLFDSDTLITQLNQTVATQRADVREYAEMREKFLVCREEDVFWKLTAQYMPDNSFLCLNEGLSVQEIMRKDVKKKNDAFTENMQAIIKIHGEVFHSKCYSEKVVPELGKNMNQSMPVIVLPIHFCERVLGYMGVWLENGRGYYLDKVFHFLLSYDNSAGLRLVE